MNAVRNKAPIDTGLQAQVDAQLMEQGAFAPLDLLLESGRLMYADYESWRRREIEWLDGVLMGSPEKIRAQLEQAVRYARSIGLVEQEQEFHEWPASAAARADTTTETPGASDSGGRSSGGGSGSGGRDTAARGPGVTARPLRVSADAQLHRLICSRYVPAQNAPQMDLFFDNPVVALTNGIVRALSAKNLIDAQRQLDRLYAHAPNHADLAAFDLLVAALGHLNQAVSDAQQEQDFLLQITPTARRLLGSQSRDLLAPLWRQVAQALEGHTFTPAQPTLHRSFALSQAQDWAGVSECVLREPQWWLHPALCLRLAQSGFYRRRRAEALTAWCHLCWLNSEQATDVLDNRRQPDPELTALWQEFLDSEEECCEPDAGVRADSDADAGAALTAADFPAWLLLRDPALAAALGAGLPTGSTPGENRYRSVHRWIEARRAGRQDEEIALRKELQVSQPALFRYLKQTVSRK